MCNYFYHITTDSVGHVASAVQKSWFMNVCSAGLEAGANRLVILVKLTAEHRKKSIITPHRTHSHIIKLVLFLLPVCPSAEPRSVLPQCSTRVHSGTSALHAAASGLRPPQLQKLQQDALLPHHRELQPRPGYTHTPPNHILCDTASTNRV